MAGLLTQNDTPPRIGPRRRAERSRSERALADAARPVTSTTGSDGRRPARRRHRSWLCRRSPAVVIIGVAAGVAGTSWCYRLAFVAGSGVEPVGPDVVRHVLVSACLAIAVLSHGAALRAAGYPRPAALLPWLVVLVPVTIEVSALSAELYLRSGAALDPVSARTLVWGLASHPGWTAALALLAADGWRSTWRPSTLACAVTAVATLAGATWWVGTTSPSPSPTWLSSGVVPVAAAVIEDLRGWELGPLRAVLVAMTVCAALLAGSRLPAARRWTLALGCAAPAAALAILPTLLTAQHALTPAQRWTVVLYPLAALGAAAPAAFLALAGDLLEHRKGDRQ
jgi:hypothetical protein